MTILNIEHIKPGDVVFNIFQEELIVNAIHHDFTNNEHHIICVNTGLFLESYSADLLYTNLNDLTLPEYSFLIWVKKNKNDLLSLDNNTISMIRKAYLEAYSQGFNDKPRCSGNKCKGNSNVMD